eukprot:491196-Pyramimonas_sp.AAC.1
MRTAPRGPSVEPRWGQETLYWVGETHADCAAGTFGGAPVGPRNAAPNGGDACELRRRDLRW